MLAWLPGVRVQVVYIALVPSEFSMEAETLAVESVRLSNLDSGRAARTVIVSRIFRYYPT